MKFDRQEVKLGEIIDVLTDYHANGSYKILKKNVTLLDTPDHAVMIRTTNFESNEFTGNLKFITKDAYEFLKKSKVVPGDLVMNKIANAGSIYFMPDLKKPVSLAMNLFLIRINKNRAVPRFVYFYLKANENYVKSFAQGSVTKTITKEAVKNLNLYLPSLEVQEEIVKIIGGIEDKISLNTQTNQTLEALAQALFKSWFVDFDPVKAKARLKQQIATEGGDWDAGLKAIAEELALSPDVLALFPDELEESELGWIPKGWEIKCIGDIAKLVKGKSYKSAELEDSKTALVTLKSFKRGGGYRLDGLKEYTGSYKPEQEVFSGDLVIAYTDVTQAADVIGKPAMVISDSRYDHLVISLDVAVIRSHDDCMKYFLYGLAMTDSFQSHTKSHSTGTTVLHLSKEAVPTYKFCRPPIELVEKYSAFSTPLFQRINDNVENDRTLTQLRDTLLPKLLSGEITLASAESTLTSSNPDGVTHE